MSEEICLDSLVKSKLIVCLRGRANIGKSDTIRELTTMLYPISVRPPVWHRPTNLTLPPVPRNHSVEVWIQKTKGVTHVGLDTEGDNGDVIRDRVGNLARQGCYLIFCTCRSQRDPLRAVHEIANQYGYNLVTTAPYTLEIPNPPTLAVQAFLNHRKAEHLETFIP